MKRTHRSAPRRSSGRSRSGPLASASRTLLSVFALATALTTPAAAPKKRRVAAKRKAAAPKPKPRTKAAPKPKAPVKALAKAPVKALAKVLAKTPAKAAAKTPSKTAPSTRHGLGEVVRMMDEMGRMFGSGSGSGAGSAATAIPPAAAETPPAAGRFLSREHACDAGARSYRLYIPASAATRPAGLIVMLHGCTQTPEDFAAGARMNAHAEIHRLIVAYPRQTRSDNRAACWNWYRGVNQKREAGEPAIIATLAQALATEFGIGREATFVAGLSAGGAMAATLGRVYPEVFSAVGVHSGMAPGAASDVFSALSAMRNGARGAAHRRAASTPAVRAIVFQGSADSTVHPSNAAHVATAAAPLARAAPGLAVVEAGRVNGRACTRSRRLGLDGRPAVEVWMVEGAGHAWSGGGPAGKFTDPLGPDASEEMVRFFLGRRSRRIGKRAVATPPRARGTGGR